MKHNYRKAVMFGKNEKGDHAVGSGLRTSTAPLTRVPWPENTRLPAEPSTTYFDAHDSKRRCFPDYKWLAR